MKKILSILLAICFVVSAFCIPAYASYADQLSTAYIQYGTTAHDLRAYGIHTFRAFKVATAPSLADTGIDPGQYGGAPSDEATLGNGLTLTNSTATTDYTEEAGADWAGSKVTSYLAYDDSFVYIAEKVETPAEISVLAPDGVTLDTLKTNVRYGLNQSTAIPEAASRLSNTYEYEQTASGYSVVGCTSGNRTYRTIDGQVSKSATLDYDVYGAWNMNKYSYNCALHTYEAGGMYTYEFEYKIPLGDVIFSANGAWDDAQVAALLAKNQFYGSFMFQVAVTRTGAANGKTQLYLTTGYAGGKTIEPYSGSGASSTWAKAVKAYWTNSKNESASIVYVPSPVLHTNDINTVVPPATQFKPNLTGFRIDQFGSVFKVGDKAKFTLIPDCVENTAPVEGDLRVIPTKFRVRNGYDTKLNGAISEDFKSGEFSTSKLPVGLNTLVVTFVQQRFDGTKWVDTSVTKNLSRNFTVSGSVMGVSVGSAQTGDSTVIFLAAGSVMILAAAAFSVIILRKKVK